MIVRISGTGQFDIDDACVRRLDELDTKLTDAINSGDEQAFHDLLRQTIELVRSSGSAVPANHVVPSDVIIPPEDVSLEEAKSFFTDEGLMEPLPA